MPRAISNPATLTQAMASKASTAMASVPSGPASVRLPNRSRLFAATSNGNKRATVWPVSCSG
jgi:hypothetical protein